MVDIYSKYDKNSAKQAVEASASPEYGFTDRFTASRKEAFQVGTAYGRHRTFENLVEQQREIIEKHGLGIRIPGMIQRVNHGRPIQSEKLLEIIRTNKEEFDRIRAERPELGLKTVEELEQEQINQYSQIINANQKAADSSTFMGYLGAGAGTVFGTFQDPGNAATLFFPAARVTKAMSVMQAAKAGALAEIKAAAIPVIANKPGEIEARRSAGEDVSILQGVIEGGIEIGAAGAIGGLIGAGVNKLTKVRSAKTEVAANVVEDVSHLESVRHPSVSETQHIDILNQKIEEVARGVDIDKKIDIEPAPAHKLDPEIPEQQAVDAPPKLVRDADIDPELSKAIDTDIKTMDSDINIYNKVRTCLTGGES